MRRDRVSDTQLARLEQVLGGARTTTDSQSLAAYEIDGVRPSAAARPADAREVAELVRAAAAEELAVIPCSGRSKLAIGGLPSRYDVALDLSAMNRVVSYDPGDLTLSVEPGARIEDLQSELGQHGQFLPLEVAFSERATVGGAIATNAYSPLRAHFGSARDFVLGTEFVTGLGEIAKSGGRVVKNVTGYDLHKLLIGSLGTLAVVTRVHFRTFPRPAERRVFTAAFATSSAAHEFCRAVAASALEPRAIEMLDPDAAKISRLAAQAAADARAWRVVIAAAGSVAVVERHARDLERMARAAGAIGFDAWSGADAAKCLRAIREFVRLAREHFAEAAILRLALLPTSAAALAERLAAIADAHALDSALAIGAAGSAGTGYVALWPHSEKRAETSFVPTKDGAASKPPDSARDTTQQDARENSLAAAISAILEASGSAGEPARGFVEWCPTALKSRISLSGEAREDFVLMQRVKQIFDPHGVLAPGRYYGGL
jgi:glycolate oxidase FAD binding subunit